MEKRNRFLETEMSRRKALLALSLGVSSLLLGCSEAAPQHTEVQSSVSTEIQLPAPTESVTPMAPESAKPTGEFSTEPAWQQDFTHIPNGPIDTSIWRYELDPVVPGYNNEAQAYTDSTKNVRIENGKLILEAHREAYTYPNNGPTYEITSGRIDTRDSLNFEYGKIEATIKFPEGAGTWPAFWLLSANSPYTSALNPTDADWAKDRFYLHDGELDVEAYGNNPGIVEATVHTFQNTIEGQIAVPDASSAFHTYGIEVTPTQLVWTIDGKPYHTFTKPSDNPDEWPFGNGNQFYAIFNLAMGGSGGGEIDPSFIHSHMEISDIKYYPLAK